MRILKMHLEIILTFSFRIEFESICVNQTKTIKYF